MRKITEANVNLSINDLNSSDMAALSQILSLAGQAESSGGLAGGMGGMAASNDLGSYEGLSGMSGPDGDMASDVGSMDMGTTPAPFDMGMDLGLDDDSMDEPEIGLDDPMGIEPELGQGVEPEMAEPGVDEPMGMDLPMNDDPMDDEFGGDDSMGELDVDLGLEDEGDMDPMDMEMMEQFERMYSLAGIKHLAESDIQEEVIEEEVEELDEGVDEEVIEEDVEELDEGVEEELDDAEEPTWLKDKPTDDKASVPPAGAEKQVPTWMRESLNAMASIFESDDEDMEEDEEQLDENTDGLYNLDLDEDAVEEMRSPGIGDNRVFGPYPNELACMTDARKEIPGAMRDREVKLTHKPDGFYWSKLQQEDATNSRPKIQDVCTKGIKSDKHAQTKNVSNLGDNGLVDMMESEQSVADYAKQLNEQFNRFLKGE